MYFESSKGTPAHYDHCFLDALEEDKEMYGAWIALEDIAESAGRFYVYPGSHLAASPGVGARVNRLHSEFITASRTVINLYDQGPSIQCLRYVKKARPSLRSSFEQLAGVRSHRF